MDFDHDGLMDVVSGSYHPGDVYVFRKQSDGTFAKGEKILNKDGKPVNAGAAAAAYLVDWDADGDLDLIVGNIQSEVYLIPNEGTRDKPAYGAKQALTTADGTAIKVGGSDAGPTVADWDGDGKQDLIVGGGDGCVMLFRNTSDDKAKPSLAAAQTLVPPSTVMARRMGAGAVDEAERLGSPLKHGMRAKPHVADFNGDGKLDLLVGDFQSIESKKEQTPEQKQKQAQSEQKLRELTAEQQKLAVPPDDETQEQRKERQKQLRNVQRQIIEHSRTAMAAAQPPKFETHGHVWVYLRKDAVQKTAQTQGEGS